MKIFISHSSKNTNYGNALIDLLIGVGVPGEEIIFTSNDAHGIPTGENIFNWLKDKISEKPYVLYLLSPEYYTSVACLNEMGAAWIVENEHTMIFTPDFNLRSYEFQNGALDPREIGFYLNNQDRLILFIESLKKHFSVSSNPVLINQKVREFVNRIEKISSNKSNSSSKEIDLSNRDTIVSTESEKSIEKAPTDDSSKKIKKTNKSIKITDPADRFINDLVHDKLKDEEVILIHYIRETGRFKLGTGWQASHEIENIKEWEDIHQLNDTLSSKYETLLRRMEMKKLTEVSDLTSYGNPKEVMIKDQLQEKILNLTEDEQQKLKEVIDKCPIDNWNF